MKIIPNAVQVFLDVIERELKQGVVDPEVTKLMEKYQAGKLKIVDHVIYANRAMGGLTSVEFFKSDDAKLIGSVNLANQKLDHDTYFVPYGVQLVCGDLGAAATAALLHAEPYDDIFNAGGVLNSAELTVKANSGEYLLDETGVAEFITANSEGMKGLKILSSTFLWKPGTKIEAQIKTAVAAAANLGVGIRFLGAKTMPKA